MKLEILTARFDPGKCWVLLVQHVSGKPLLEIKADGRIILRGKLIGTDKEVADYMRAAFTRQPITDMPEPDFFSQEAES